jgi:hypothetical protein
MKSQKRQSQRVLLSILLGVCVFNANKVKAAPPSLRASIGSSVVLMETGDPMFDLSGRLELEAFRLTSQKPSKSVWVFEVIGMKVPYPAI